ncbi:MAG: hypothetical protein ABL961_18045 [Vicinamibacterales bacterium]
MGRKGSGKTYFIRRVRDEALNGPSANFVTTVQEEPPSTELVVLFTRRWDSPSSAISKWADLWTIAILSSVASHAARNEALSRHIPDRGLIDLIEKEFSYLFATRQYRPCDACEQVQHLLSDRRQRIDILLTSNIAQDLRYRVQQLLANAPPAYFFIDGMDNFFDQAPYHWLLCQRGLLQAVRSVLTMPHIGGKLHVSVALRDVIWSSAKSGSEHSLRFIDPTYTRVLEWNSDAARYFLEQKLQRLDSRWFKRFDKGNRSVANWIGIDVVHNLRYGKREPVVDYLLRHTRFLPRDIVVIGNSLCERLAGISSDDISAIASEVRDTVSYCAKLFGQEQIQICAAELVSHLMPAKSTGRGEVASFVESPDLTSAVAERINVFLHDNVGGIRLSKNEFDQLAEKWREFTASEYSVSSVDLRDLLWRNRLLGYRSRSNGRDLFFSDREIGSRIPTATEYVFHPILTDTLDLAANGDSPVVPSCE